MLTAETGARMSAKAPSAAATAREGVGAHLRPAGVDLAAVEARAFRRIAKNVVGGIQFFKPFLGLFIPRKEVRMGLFGGSPEGFLNLGIAGVTLHAQNGIGVFSHQWSVRKNIYLLDVAT